MTLTMLGYMNKHVHYNDVLEYYKYKHILFVLLYNMHCIFISCLSMNILYNGKDIVYFTKMLVQL